jgi:hypothetical protein
MRFMAGLLEMVWCGLGRPKLQACHIGTGL